MEQLTFKVMSEGVRILNYLLSHERQLYDCVYAGQAYNSSHLAGFGLRPESMTGDQLLMHLGRRGITLVGTQWHISREAIQPFT